MQSSVTALVESKEESANQRDLGIGPLYQIPDELWNRIKVLLPAPRKKKKMGRPRMDYLKAMNAIFYVLRTGIQWKALPRSIGAPSTVHDRFQEWAKAGVFQRLWREGLIEYDVKKGIDWEWQSMDCAITKALLSGGKAQDRIQRTEENLERREAC